MSNKVLMLEFNEINWTVIDQLVTERGPGYLPNLCRLRQQGTWGSPVALEQPPHLDPWVTWVTVHTGTTQAVHGAKVLEQDAATVGARRSWEYLNEAGRSVGIFGSVGAYPPGRVNGFVVPGPFAPADDTYPSSLSSIQALNRGHTHAHGGSKPPESIGRMLKSGLKLFRLGLRVGTCGRVAAQLIRERLDHHTRWRRVMLQPLVNYDFFAELYRRQRPDFATWHTNHAAHFMHHYWRAWNDTGFSQKSPREERARYGEAVPSGYQLCDELLGRFLRLMDADTVLLVCSSMGQQPFANASYREGKVIVRFRDVANFLRTIDAQGVTEIVPTMVPQVNLRVPEAAQRAALAQRIRGVVRRVAGAAQSALAVEETGDLLTITPMGLSTFVSGITYEVPGTATPIPLQDLFALDAPTVKQGMHHPRGLFIAYGRNIPAGVELDECTNLDIAPTVLSLLGVPIPSTMSGHNLLGPSASLQRRTAMSA